MIVDREMEVLRELIRYHITGLDTQPDIFKYIMLEIGNNKEKMKEFIAYVKENRNVIGQDEILDKLEEIGELEECYDGIEKVIWEDVRLAGEVDEDIYNDVPELRNIKVGDRIPAEILRKLTDMGEIDWDYPEGVEIEFIDPEEEE